MTPRIEQLSDEVRPEEFLSGKVTLWSGDCLDVLKRLDANSVDSVVTDPPYGLEFMGKGWDGADGFRRSLNKADAGRESVFGRTSKRGPEYKAGALFQEFIHAVATECLRVLKPGGHLVAFGGTRTQHRMVCGVEDAGFEIRDMLAWLYGSGFNKDGYLSYKRERTLCERRENENYYRDTGEQMRRSPPFRHPDADAVWGLAGALKPAIEPICFARKPLSESVAANVLKWGTGALNIDACRVEGAKPDTTRGAGGQNGRYGPINAQGRILDDGLGRWPANLIHDGSDEVVGAFPAETSSGHIPRSGNSKALFGGAPQPITDRINNGYGDSGSAARFFYTAKADADDRLGSKHPTIKPLDLMQWLVRLVTPPGGTVLDMFAGTGTTGEAAWREGFNVVLIEREPEYQADIRRRMAHALSGPQERKIVIAKSKKPVASEGLFALLDPVPVASASPLNDRSATGVSQ